MTMNLDDLKKLPLRKKIAMAEQAAGLFKQMVANGQEKLTPKSVKALRDLETEIALAKGETR